VSIYEIPIQNAAGQETTLAPYRGQVLLIVNVASRCGFTGQYAGLEALHQKYHAQGLAVLGFPCNQFLWQEPGDNSAIQQFCSTKYSVTFPVFAKVKVNGSSSHPLFQLLKSAKRGTLGTKAIKWNFTKFLVSRAGEVVARYGPGTEPAKLDQRIEELLKAATSASGAT
jgi:glutathione peroxidase